MTNAQPDPTNPAGARRPSSLADMVTLSTPAASPAAISRGALIKIGVLGALFVALNFWQFRVLINAWIKDANWSHGFIIPLFSLYLLYVRRDELFRTECRVCLWGLPLLVVSLLVMALGFYPISNYWICQLSMVGMLLGLVLYLAGPRMALLTWLPICYLALGMPLPGSLYTDIAYPLQRIAAASSAFLLKVSGVALEVTESHMDITSIGGTVHPMDVAEACSGVRSLMAFIALGIAMAYVEPRPLWQRITLVAATAPITIACNILRVTATAEMFVIDKPELGKDVMHEMMGMVLLVPALGMLLLLSWLLKSMFVEADDGDDDGEDETTDPQAPGNGAAKA